MKKYRGKIIAAAVIAAILALVYWWGGNSPALHGWNIQEKQSASEVKKEPSEPQTDKNQNQQKKNETETENDIKTPQTENTENAGEATPENRPQNPDNTPMTAEEKIELAEKLSENASENVVNEPVRQTGEVTYSDKNGLKMSGSETDEVQSAPITGEEKQDRSETANTEHTCTLSVRCDSILSNMAWLDPAKTELVPSDGIIFAEQTVTFYEGESVFNLLLREMKKNKIHMEFENTPIYNSAYVEGIANLYEFDCGELSGWMYKVNGWFPNYGCSRYELKDGDRVEWVYTCNLGIDVGGYYSSKDGKKDE